MACVCVCVCVSMWNFCTFYWIAFEIIKQQITWADTNVKYDRVAPWQHGSIELTSSVHVVVYCIILSSSHTWMSRWVSLSPVKTSLNSWLRSAWPLTSRCKPSCEELAWRGVITVFYLGLKLTSTGSVLNQWKPFYFSEETNKKKTVHSKRHWSIGRK